MRSILLLAVGAAAGFLVAHQVAPTPRTSSPTSGAAARPRPPTGTAVPPFRGAPEPARRGPTPRATPTY
jgi:hypothetical protein